MFVATHTATSRAAALAARRSLEPDDEDGSGSVTLGEAFETTMRERWRGTRSERTIRSQARQAITAVGAVAMQDESRQAQGSGSGDALTAIRLADVTLRHVAFVVDAWRSSGLHATTINKRLTCLSVMGVEVAGRRVKRPRVLKWWLKPDVEVALVKRLAAAGDQLMADYITWTTHTGLRVEESLALTRGAFSVDDAGGVSVTVPGTKTSGSQASFRAAVQAWNAADSILAPHLAEQFKQGVNPAAFRFKTPKSLGDVVYNAAIVPVINVIGTPTRAMGTVDELIKQTVYRSKVSARAHVDGVERGLEGEDLTAFVRDRLFASRT